MDDGTSKIEKSKRAPRKRTSTQKTARSTAGTFVTHRQRAVRKKVADERLAEKLPETKIKKPKVEKKTEVVAKSIRKAPTPLAAEIKEKRAARIRAAVVFGIMVIGVGSSAAIGFTDQGGINVNQVIESRNQKITESGSNELLIPVQNTNQEPDGGLIGLGVGTPKATSTKSESSASTTDNATSTGSIPLSTREADSQSTGATSSSPSN